MMCALVLFLPFPFSLTFGPFEGAEQGRICLDLLKMPPNGAWKPASNIRTVLTSIQLLMSEPNPDDALMADIAEHFKSDRAGFDATAKAWTAKHASEAAVEAAAAAAPAPVASVPAAAAATKSLAAGLPKRTAAAAADGSTAGPKRFCADGAVARTPLEIKNP